MKKPFIIVILLFALSSCGGSAKGGSPSSGVQAQAAAAEEPFLFRGLPWGSPRERVIAKEGDKFAPLPSGGNEMLLYRHIKVGGQDADLGSIIDPEYGLMGGIYFFNIDTNGFPYNTKPYIDAYSGLYDTLSEIYGPPEPGSRAAKSRGGDLDDFSEYYYKGGQTAGWIQKGTLIILTLAPKTPKGFDMADWDLTVTYISPYEQESERAENRSGL